MVLKAQKCAIFQRLVNIQDHSLSYVLDIIILIVVSVHWRPQVVWTLFAFGKSKWMTNRLTFSPMDTGYHTCWLHIPWTYWKYHHRRSPRIPTHSYIYPAISSFRQPPATCAEVPQVRQGAGCWTSRIDCIGFEHVFLPLSAFFSLVMKLTHVFAVCALAFFV